MSVEWLPPPQRVFTSGYAAFGKGQNLFSSLSKHPTTHARVAESIPTCLPPPTRLQDKSPHTVSKTHTAHLQRATFFEAPRATKKKKSAGCGSMRQLRGGHLQTGAAVTEQLRHLLARQVLVKPAHVVHLTPQPRVGVGGDFAPSAALNPGDAVRQGEGTRAHLQRGARLQIIGVPVGVVRAGPGVGRGVAVQVECESKS